MRDAEIYRLIEEAKKEVYANLGKGLGMVEFLAQQSAYRLTAFISMFSTLPVVGPLFLKLLQKKLDQFESLVQLQAQAEKQKRRGKKDGQEKTT